MRDIITIQIIPCVSTFLLFVVLILDFNFCVMRISVLVHVLITTSNRGANKSTNCKHDWTQPCSQVTIGSTTTTTCRSCLWVQIRMLVFHVLAQTLNPPKYQNPLRSHWIVNTNPSPSPDPHQLEDGDDDDDDDCEANLGNSILACDLIIANVLHVW